MAHTATIRNLNDRPRATARRQATVLVGLVILLACANPASAELYPVNALADGDDGTCDAHCTLREAIEAANGNTGLDYITIPAGVLTLSDPAGALNISDTVFITGQGAETTVIDATGLGDRVLHVSVSGETVWITNLTITGGTAATDGGGILHAAGHLSLSTVVVRDNTADVSSGGIHSYLASVTIDEGSAIIRNSAGADWCGGGISGNDVTIIDTTISGNVAGCGGGVYSSGSLTISGSTIAGNTALGWDGGGIAFDGVTAEISRTTIAGNHSGRMGGAVYAAGGASVSLDAVTISGNSSTTGESIRSADSTVNLTNTLVTEYCLGTGSAVFLSNGGNLESPGNTCGLTPGSDLISVADPMLWPLSHYGGPTPTMMPRPGSPVLDAGSNTHCLPFDQRNEPRSDGFCDIGAVERQSTESDPIFVDGFESGSTSAWS